MIETISGLPDNAVGVSAKGTVTAEDYESVIIPAVEKAFSNHDKIRLLYHIGEAFTGCEAGALWDDTKLYLKHFTGWERMAVVSDVEWVRTAVKIFGFGMPGELRLFHNNEFDEAKRWISE